MGVNLGVLPTKGLTLPLMSYGGSAILMNWSALAIVLRIDYENRVLHARRPRYEAHDADRDGGRHRRPYLPRPGRRRSMRARGWRVHWLGAPDGMESQLVPPARHRVRHASTSPACAARACCNAGVLPLRLLERVLAQPRASCARRQARRGARHGRLRHLSRRHDGVPAAASRWCCIEADAALLLANRILTPVARRVPFGFPADFGAAAGKAPWTGNPVRAAIVSGLPPPAQRFAAAQGRLRLLVVGGSLGAKALNERCRRRWR